MMCWALTSDIFAPRSMRQRFIDEWIRTRHFQLSELDAGDFRERMVADCSTTGDFLRIFMGGIANVRVVAAGPNVHPHTSHTSRRSSVRLPMLCSCTLSVMVVMSHCRLHDSIG